VCLMAQEDEACFVGSLMRKKAASPGLLYHFPPRANKVIRATCMRGRSDHVPIPHPGDSAVRIQHRNHRCSLSDPIIQTLSAPCFIGPTPWHLNGAFARAKPLPD
jgi:hypothetical protein